MSECNLRYNGPVPEGYELTGEFRPARNGDYYILFKDGGSADAYRAETRSPEIILRKKRWMPKDGDPVWRVTLYDVPRKWTFSSMSMRKDYECGMLYRTEKEAHEASALLTSTLMDLFEKLNYAWQETLE